MHNDPSNSSRAAQIRGWYCCLLPAACCVLSRAKPALFAFVVTLWSCGLAAAAPSSQPSAAACEVRVVPLGELAAAAGGAFVGSQGKVVIVAGGIAEPPKDGELSSARLLDSIHFLEPAVDGRPAQWKTAAAKLPVPLACGATVSTDAGVLCIGGWSGKGPCARIIRLRYSAGDVLVEQNLPDYPDLPVGLALAGAAAMDGVLYVAGGYAAPAAPGSATGAAAGGPTDAIHCLESSAANGAQGFFSTVRRAIMPAVTQRAAAWQLLPATSPDGRRVTPLGGGVVLPVLQVRRNEWAYKNALFVMGGWKLAAGRYVPLGECWQYTPGTASRCGWKSLAALPAEGAIASAVPAGPSHLLTLIEDRAAPAAGLAALALRRNPGRLFTYHTYTNRWVDLDRPVGPAGQMVKLPDESGTRAPAGRLPAVVHSAIEHLLSPQKVGTVALLHATDAGLAAEKGRLEYRDRYMSWLDYSLILLYLAAMLGIGRYFSRRNKNTDDYFLGGRKIPWWAAGLSIWATGVSAISMMAIPAKTYMTDWSYVCLGIIPPVTTAVVAYLFVPLLRRLQITTVMEYLEMRFGRSIRIMATILMVIGTIGGRMAVVLLLPSIALSAVTGIPVWVAIVLMGAISTIYTMIGGLEAVVWTDVVQTFLMFGGAILSLVLVACSAEGGVGAVAQVAIDHSKLRMFDFSWDLSIASFWVFLIWGVSDMFGRLGQEGLQRAFSTPDVKSARRSMMTCAWVSIPGTIIFYALGSALYAYYQQHPQQLNPNIDNDSISPLFMVQQMPRGVAGLVVAGIFAASMSTFSAINSLSAVIVRDWYSLFQRTAPQRAQLRAAKWITAVAGVLVTFVAWLFSIYARGSLWDAFSETMALIGGGFGCVIVLALLTRRTSTACAWIGAVAGTVLLLAIKVFEGQNVTLLGRTFEFRLSFFTFATASMACGFLIGWLLGFVFPSRKDLHGLTLWTIRRDGAAGLDSRAASPLPEPVASGPADGPPGRD